jgi:hypothetical protein
VKLPLPHRLYVTGRLLKALLRWPWGGPGGETALGRRNATPPEQLERARKAIEVQGELSALLDRLANGSARDDSEPSS